MNKQKAAETDNPKGFLDGQTNPYNLLILAIQENAPKCLKALLATHPNLVKSWKGESLLENLLTLPFPKDNRITQTAKILLQNYTASQKEIERTATLTALFSDKENPLEKLKALLKENKASETSFFIGEITKNPGNNINEIAKLEENHPSLAVLFEFTCQSCPEAALATLQRYPAIPAKYLNKGYENALWVNNLALVEILRKNGAATEKIALYQFINACKQNDISSAEFELEMCEEKIFAIQAVLQNWGGSLKAPILKWLLKKGADPNYLKLGIISLLEQTAIQGNEESFQVLLESNAKPHQESLFGTIIRTTNNGHMELAKTLAEFMTKIPDPEFKKHLIKYLGKNISPENKKWLLELKDKT